MRVLKIKSRKDLEKALARLDEIWAAKPGDADWDERRTLVERITVYEDANIHIPPPDPVDAISFRMDQGGLKPKDLVPFIGTAAKVSEVLNRKRGLSKGMICRLHEGLGIPLASLLGVERDVPEGFETVECHLPTDVFARLAASAAASGVSVSAMVSSLIMATPWALGSPVAITDGAALSRSTSELFTPEALENRFAKAG
jgi:HTH-type transcriptional regulator/antitoxin HigA